MRKGPCAKESNGKAKSDNLSVLTRKVHVWTC